MEDKERTMGFLTFSTELTILVIPAQPLNVLFLLVTDQFVKKHNGSVKCYGLLAWGKFHLENCYLNDLKMTLSKP